MARSHSPGLLIGKWIVVPVLVALFGYYVIGPRLGNSKAKPKAVSQQISVPATPADSPDQHPTSPPATTATQTTAAVSQPDLDITVSKVKHHKARIVDTDPETKPRKHRKPTPKSDDIPKAKDTSDDQHDEGGSAGATTAG